MSTFSPSLVVLLTSTADEVLPVVIEGSRKGSSAGRTGTFSAKATNEVARFLSGSDICAGDIVDMTTPKSAVSGASCHDDKQSQSHKSHIKFAYCINTFSFITHGPCPASLHTKNPIVPRYPIVFLPRVPWHDDH